MATVTFHGPSFLKVGGSLGPNFIILDQSLEMFTFLNEITDLWMHNLHVLIQNCNDLDAIHIFVVKLSSATIQSMYHVRCYKHLRGSA